jgi:hypothetical protein
MFPEHILYYNILWSYYLSQLLCNFCNKCHIKLHAIKTLRYSQEVPICSTAAEELRTNEKLNSVVQYILMWCVSVCEELNYK